MSDDDVIMTADEVAKFLRVDRKTVYEGANRGQIPHRRLGRRLLFSRAAILAWLERREPPPLSPPVSPPQPAVIPAQLRARSWIVRQPATGTALSAKILEAVRREPGLRSADYARVVDGYGTQVSYEIGALVRAGKLTKLGERHASRYALSEPPGGLDVHAPK